MRQYALNQTCSREMMIEKQKGGTDPYKPADSLLNSRNEPPHDNHCITEGKADQPLE